MGFLIPVTLIFLVLFFFIPILVGGGFTVLSTLGWDFFQPCSDCYTLAFSKLFSHPQFFPSLFLTLRTSLLAAVFSLILVFFIAGGWGNRFPNIIRFMPLGLAYPHVALSIGLVFLISPSGFLVRWVGSLWGIDTPLNWETYQDPFGLSLIVGLTIKETLFLLFMALSQLSQIKVGEHYQMATSLGYTPTTTWLKVIWPQVYRGIRFPFLIVLCYSFSAVDMGMILAGNTPPPLAILILQWFQDPNLNYSRISSAGSLVLILSFLATVGGIWIAEKILHIFMRWLIFRGNRSYLALELGLKPQNSWILFALLLLILSLSFTVNGIWSLAQSWPFPELLPTRYTGQAWNFLKQDMGGILFNTLGLAITSALLGLGAAVVILEIRFSRFSFTNPLNFFLSRTLIFLPLLLPSVSLFISIRIFFLTVAPHLPTWLITLIGHCLITFPYALLTLEKPYHSFNQNYFIAAQTLSRSELISYFRIKFPMLKKPLLSSLAIALSVSVMDYLATTILSAGRIATLTTEAVQLSGGGHPRILGFFAIIQTLILSLIFLSCFNFTPQSNKLLDN